MDGTPGLVKKYMYRDLKKCVYIYRKKRQVSVTRPKKVHNLYKIHVVSLYFSGSLFLKQQLFDLNVQVRRPSVWANLARQVSPHAVFRGPRLVHGHDDVAVDV